MRVLLFTGKGGVGKTTTAAATGALAAARGLKTLVISTDPAHSLADALGTALGPDPAEVDAGLYGQQVDVQLGFERAWAEIRGYLADVFESTGVNPLEAEELMVLPGAEEVLALQAVRTQVAGGRFDLVVVDCAPTAETLRLLALPDALQWYMRRIFPVERRVVRSLRPVLSRAAGVPMPRDSVFEAVLRLHADLTEIRTLLAEPRLASVRLVLTPEAVVVAEARRTLTTLSLHGYQVDAVIANRVFPDGGDSWREGWASAQARHLREVEASFAPLPVLRATYRAAEPVGLRALTELATDLYADVDPTALPTAGEPLRVCRTEEGYDLVLWLPFAERGEVSLSRHGDELAVTVGSHRRVLALPSALRRCQVSGARFRDGRLLVSFLPDPRVWMQR
ncbi:MAG: ArsA family ATPase [Frankiaceae bacterium]